MLLSALLVLLSVQWSVAAAAAGGPVAISNISCTIAQTNGTVMLAPNAVVCTDNLDTSSCASLFANAPTDTTALFAAGAQNGAGYRPQSLTVPTISCEDSLHRDAAAKLCPKFCGYCCLTPEYNCPNVSPSPTPCDQVTSDMCKSPEWRPTLAQYCPSACGFCTSGGCVDAVTGCDNGGASVCFSMPTFAATNCQRTCKMCQSTTGGTSTVSGYTTSGYNGGCTTYAPDKTPSCANWKRNGFCENTFYTQQYKRENCATSCRLC